MTNRNFAYGFLLISFACCLLGLVLIYLHGPGALSGLFMSGAQSRAGYAWSSSGFIDEQIAGINHLVQSVDWLLVAYSLIAVLGAFLSFWVVLRSFGKARPAAEVPESPSAVQEPAAVVGVNRFPSLAPAILNAAWGIGMTARMVVVLSVIFCFLGVLIAFAASSIVATSIETAAVNHGSGMAAVIAQRVDLQLQSKKQPDLLPLLKEDVDQTGLAYIYVTDSKGTIIEQTTDAKLVELVKPFTLFRTGVNDPRVKFIKMGSDHVYELQAPIAAGKRGSLHLGLWEASVAQSIGGAVSPITNLIVVSVLICIALSGLLLKKLNQPIMNLVERANQISTGELDAPAVVVQSGDEVGELSRSIERMRSSLKAAMSRLARSGPAGR